MGHEKKRTQAAAERHAANREANAIRFEENVTRLGGARAFHGGERPSRTLRRAFSALRWNAAQTEGMTCAHGLAFQPQKE